MTLSARLSNLLFRSARGRQSSSADDLAVNFSFVLHESSSSVPVRKAVESSRRHGRVRHHTGETILDGDPGIIVDSWLTTSIGEPHDLGTELHRAGLSNTNITFIDRRDGLLHPAVFFRDQADLTLPSHATGTVGVAALIVRPQGQDRQLIVRGPFTWSTERKQTLRALEEIIQAHLEQWMPESRLWIVPAEIIFPDEIR